ncbi:MAG: hypothetical protein H0U49_01790, partial [Parachlamydiaceae bacterium]|nr:hypothetical protein [Parachlamydiaceae bacterium]
KIIISKAKETVKTDRVKSKATIAKPIIKTVEAKKSQKVSNSKKTPERNTEPDTNQKKNLITGKTVASKAKVKVTKVAPVIKVSATKTASKKATTSPSIKRGKV